MLRTDNHKTAIFVCNSPKDGFREGDGDYLDKLTTELNTVSPLLSATRIVASKPPAEIKRPPGQLIVVDDLPEIKDGSLKHLHYSQQKIVRYIASSPADKKFLYIGSRIDNFKRDEANILSISVGSGALLTEAVVLALKKHDVKIVVCCLEAEFFTRSLASSFRLYEMLRNHLQHADAIHCLTIRDKEFIQVDLQTRLVAESRLVHAAVPVETIEHHLGEGRIKGIKKQRALLESFSEFFKRFFARSKKQYDAYFSRFKGKEIAQKLKTTPCVYASGICTITELNADAFTQEQLMKRPKNVLVFGLIRPHKGIEEGLALGKKFMDEKVDVTVFIVGKLVSFNNTILKIFNQIFDPEVLNSEALRFKERFKECNHSQDRNHSFQKLYDDLIAAGVKKQAKVELVLNVSEENLLRFVLCCRYALKWDLKGFAENASTVSSAMFGLGLPSIVPEGLLTPPSVALYGKGLCLLKCGLRLHNGEVVPGEIDLNLIMAIIQESDKDYLERIEALRVLSKEKKFSIKTTTRILLHEVFSSPVSTDSENSTPVLPSLPVKNSFVLFANQNKPNGIQKLRPAPSLCQDTKSPFAPRILSKM